MSNHLRPVQINRLLQLLSSGFLRIQENEKGIPELVQSWEEGELSPRMVARRVPPTPADPDLVLLILAAVDREPKTPERIRQLRQAAGLVPSSSVLALL